MIMLALTTCAEIKIGVEISGESEYHTAIASATRSALRTIGDVTNDWEASKRDLTILVIIATYTSGEKKEDLILGISMIAIKPNSKELYGIYSTTLNVGKWSNYKTLVLDAINNIDATAFKNMRNEQRANLQK